MTQPFPAWGEPMSDAAQMRATDRWAIETCEMASLELMERAGASVAAAVARAVPVGAVVIFCGIGHNGGDGFVAARLLAASGRDVEVFVVGDFGRCRHDAAINAQRLPGAPTVIASDADTATVNARVRPVLAGAAVIVDALLGTGAAGAPRGGMAAVIRAINDASGVVVAVDVPSGVDATTGEAPGDAVVAVHTVTFAAVKPGLRIAPGMGHAGRVELVDIGIPGGAPVTPWAGAIGPAVMAGLPGRTAESTKFTSGRVVVAGGAPGLTGAVVLAARAAMRAGAGYVTALVPKAVEPVVAGALTEVMTRALPSDADGGLTAAAVRVATQTVTDRSGALVLGPGLGRRDGAVAFARALALEVVAPLVLDADGLFAYSGSLGDLASRVEPTVLTPHEGELARLLEVGTAEVHARRLLCAQAAAAEANAVVVLKGAGTLVVAPDGRTLINTVAAPMLATAGTGDVLAGMIGALLAAGCEPLRAACTAVRWHACAGRQAAQAVGVNAVIAGDVVDALGPVRARAAG